jgi:hypothetical protein
MRSPRPTAFAVFLAAAPLFADAGAIVLRQQTDDIRITVFAAPAPLHAGPADISLLIQDVSSGEPVLDADVRLRLSFPGGPETLVPATHLSATNKILYAAPVTLQREGNWRLEGDVRARGRNIHFQTELSVLSPQQPLLTWWPWFALPAAATLLFILNQYLKHRPRPRTHRTSSGRT